MTLNLKGKTALVTGASRGIGLAVANRLLAAGASVAICARHEDSLTRAVAFLRAGNSDQTLKIHAKTADVGSESSVRELFDWIDATMGGPDVLVNNAGIGIFKDLAALEPGEWNQVIATNLSGVYHCCHHALPRMRRRGGGFIVNISSLAGKNAFAGGAAYNASKFGLCGLTEAIMLDHRYENVRVSSVMPGSVNTDFGHAANSDRKSADWKIDPQDVADTVAAILAMPDRTLISQVELRPARPPKK